MPTSVPRTAAAFTDLIERGWSIPPPGRGATVERWCALAALGAADLALARLAEGHADAGAILAELDGPAVRPGQRLGVWAAEPPAARLVARRVGGEWRLDGRKAWCSGARALTDVLVTAHADDGPRLLLAELGAGTTVDASRWQAQGMVGSDTADVEFVDVPAVAVGPVGGYVNRPGFWHGGIGVAAVWAGGARGIAAALTARPANADPLRALARGRLEVAVSAMDAVLRSAAAEVDAGPDDVPAAQRRAGWVRAFVADRADEVLGVVGRALGAGPLAHDPAHAQRVADLTVYLRQHHGERDLAALGRLVGDGA